MEALDVSVPNSAEMPDAPIISIEITTNNEWKSIIPTMQEFDKLPAAMTFKLKGVIKVPRERFVNWLTP